LGEGQKLGRIYFYAFFPICSESWQSDAWDIVLKTFIGKNKKERMFYFLISV